MNEKRQDREQIREDHDDRRPLHEDIERKKPEIDQLERCPTHHIPFPAGGTCPKCR